MTNSTLGWQDPEPEGIKSNATLLMVDYYERAFALFHDQLCEVGFDYDAIHPIRKRFWQFVPERKHELHESRELLRS
jgi:hypothetical protein